MEDESRSAWRAARRLHLAAAGALALAVFVVDTFVALGGELAVLYIIVVLLVERHLQRPGVITVSLACAGLTVTAFLLQHGLTWSDALVRCVVSLAAIGIGTFLALRGQSTRMQLREQARLLDLTHDTIFVRDMNDAITYWNRGAQERYGWTSEQAIGKSSHQLLQTIFPEPLDGIKAELLRESRWEGELLHTKRDGTQITVSSRWSLQRDKRNQPVAILETNNDITERKRAEAELRESERRYRIIFQGAGASIWEVDYSRVKAAIDEVKAQGVSDFAQYLADHPEFVRWAASLVRVIDCNDAGLALVEAQSMKDLKLLDLYLPETEAALAGRLLAIAEGRPSFQTETVLRTLKGEKRSVLVKVTFPPESKNLERVLISTMDITERTRAQEALHQAQAQLTHVTRVTTLGELAASIAHEVNQPLAAIVTNGEASLRWMGLATPNMEEVRGAIQRIVNDANRASAVIRRIRDLARKRDSETAPLDLNDVIDDVVPLVQRAAVSTGVRLRLDLSAKLPGVLGDRIQLQQVIMNLVINAIEAMTAVSDRRREVVIRSRETHREVLVEVEDRGPGVDGVNMKQLFQAFYTTKRDGMGMGLSICRSIVEAHGGRISARPGTPHGAVFEFTLPAHIQQ